MLDSAFAQLRTGISMVFGVPFSERSLDRCIAGMLEGFREFGSITAAGADLLRGPHLDDVTTRDLQLRRFRRQATLAQEHTEFYRDRRKVSDATTVDLSEIKTLQLTTKADVVRDPAAFVSSAARPQLLVTTTGSTNTACPMWFGRSEVHAFTVLSAMGLLAAGRVSPDDVVLIALRGSANLAHTTMIGACTAIGAAVCTTDPRDSAQSIDALTSSRPTGQQQKKRVSVLATYPSVLASIVELASANGLSRLDFGLDRVLLVGEIVTAGLRLRASRLFGPIEIVDSYGATEITPVGGTSCSQQHLHFEPSVGLVEMIPVLGDDKARSLVVTPFPPYRDTTLLLRFDTQDVVQALADKPTCELAHLPASGQVLGKLAYSVRLSDTWVWQRTVIEALEAVEDVPLPARFSFYRSRDLGCVDVEVVARSQDRGACRRIRDSLILHGIPLSGLILASVPNDIDRPIPVRSKRPISMNMATAGRGRSTSCLAS